MVTEDDKSAPAVETSELTKIFFDFWRRPKVKALDSISLQVGNGEIFGLLGPNGSGKTTTIKILLGLLHPTSGSVKVLGQPPSDIRVKERIGYLPEESYLYKHLTARETLVFFARLFNFDEHTIRERVDELLELVDMTKVAHRPVGEFSKGMARRIGLAQTLINDPDLIILDEPTSGLDPIACYRMKNIIRELGKKGKTVIISSHLLADIEDICSRICILYNGRILAQGALSSLLEKSDKIRFSLSVRTNEDISKAVVMLKDIFGNEPVIDSPKVTLEQFFFEIINQSKSTVLSHDVSSFNRSNSSSDEVS